MIVRSFRTYRNAPVIAAGALLITLCAASLGCALTAFYGSNDGASALAMQPVPTPLALPVHKASGAQPIAGVAEPARCAGTQGMRVRRSGHGACRLADLPPV